MAALTKAKAAGNAIDPSRSISAPTNGGPTIEQCEVVAVTAFVSHDAPSECNANYGSYGDPCIADSPGCKRRI